MYIDQRFLSDEFGPRCSCGWEGPWRMRREDAELEWAEHMARVHERMGEEDSGGV